MSKHRAHLLRTILALATLAVVLAGCSMPRLMYQQADWLLLRQIDDYLDLRDGQRERIEQALETNLSRHRLEYLPGVAGLLHEASLRASRGFADTDARWAWEQGRELLANSVELMLPALAGTLADLSPEQRQHLARRMNEANDEYIERHALLATPEEQWKRSTKRSVKLIERWTGPLYEEQVAIVHGASQSMPSIAADWLAYTLARQQDLLALLDAGAAPQAIEASLREWWIRRETLPPDTAHKREQRIGARIAMIARLDASLDSVQRAHLVGLLQELSEDARFLARAT